MHPLIALAELRPPVNVAVATAEATGKAIEIQSISRCQEKIKGQIAFLIRAEALR